MLQLVLPLLLLFAAGGLKAQETVLLESLYSSSGFQIQLYTSDSASEANIKSLKNPFAVHLSVHGYFMENQEFNPSIYQENRLLQSGMLLSGSNEFLNEKSEPRSLNDGLLTTWEIYNLDFQNIVKLRPND